MQLKSANPWLARSRAPIPTHPSPWACIPKRPYRQHPPSPRSIPGSSWSPDFPPPPKKKKRSKHLPNGPCLPRKVKWKRRPWHHGQVYLGWFVCSWAPCNTRARWSSPPPPNRRSLMLTNFGWQRDCVSTTSGIMRAALQGARPPRREAAAGRNSKCYSARAVSSRPSWGITGVELRLLPPAQDLGAR